MNDTEQRRPYAATANVVAVLERARTRNLPEAIDDEFMRISGVGDAVFGRVRQALQFLNLVEGATDAPSATLKALSRAPEAEYRELLAEAIRGAYASDFAAIDPAQDSQSQVIDAFRKYEPRSQTARMVMLFLGLCREAGIPVKDAPRDRKQQPEARKGGRMGGATKSSRGRQSRQEPRVVQASPEPPPPSPQLAGMLFGVTEDDIGVLNDNEFNEVWGALGVVARARARAKAAAAGESPSAAADSQVFDDDDDLDSTD